MGVNSEKKPTVIEDDEDEEEERPANQRWGENTHDFDLDEEKLAMMEPGKRKAMEKTQRVTAQILEDGELSQYVEAHPRLTDVMKEVMDHGRIAALRYMMDTSDEEVQGFIKLAGEKLKQADSSIEKYLDLFERLRNPKPIHDLMKEEEEEEKRKSAYNKKRARMARQDY